MRQLRNLFGLVLFAFVLGSACAEPPNPAAEHREKGDAFFRKSQWKEAAAEYAQSLAADPKQPKIWEQKAYAHQQLNESDAADEAYLHTVEGKTPAEMAEVYRGLAATYMDRKDPERAEKYYLKVVEIDPKDDLSLGWLAEIYAQRGGSRVKTPGIPELLEKSFVYYDKVIALKPDFANTYINKRIAVTKLYDTEKNIMDTANADLRREKKDKAKIEALKGKADKAKARMDELKKDYDALSAKWDELQKAAKAKAAAAAPDAGAPATAKK